MIFWFVASSLALGATFVVLRPFISTSPVNGDGSNFLSVGDLSSDNFDVQIYKDQLSELERDKNEGLISEEDSKAARTEIARRLLLVNDAKQKKDSSLPGDVNATKQSLKARLQLFVVLAIILLIPSISFIVYSKFGRPNLDDQPLVARLESVSENTEISVLVSRAEKHLATSPDDGRGYDVLGPVYLRMGRFEDSIRAFENSIRLLGSTLRRETGLGEAHFSASRGVVTAKARIAFENAAKLDPNSPQPRFYLALALRQEGRLDEAKKAFEKLLEISPKNAPWLAAVSQQINELNDNISQSGDELSGPTKEDVEEASKLSVADRQKFIRTMVGNLNKKLKENPKNFEGWKRLIRAYVVLGNHKKAKLTLSDSLIAFKEEPEKIELLKEFSVKLSLAGETE